MKYSEKINKYLQMQTELCDGFANFVSTLENRGKAVMIGGAIRDIVYYNKQPRDLDFVFWGKLDDLISTLKVKNTKNRFGGYKLHFKNLEIDIWEASDNWAFKNNFLNKSIENIHLGCLYNYDSLAWSLSDDYYEDHYFKQFQEQQILEFTNNDEDYIKSNPTPSINVLRALNIKKQHEITLSSNVKEYILEFKNEYNSNGVEELMLAELNHYRKSSWNKAELETALNNI